MAGESGNRVTEQAGGIGDRGGRGLCVRANGDAKLGVGPVGGWWAGGLKVSGHQWDDLRSAGGSTKEGQDFFANHITIPYFSHGDVVQFRGRALGSGPKYVTPSGEGARLFNADSLHGAKHAIIVEGEFDALMLVQALAGSVDRVLRATAVGWLP